jgi:phenylpyruvate tautomerase PptA (4-oxalocrotonate tautomerase family)
VANQEHLDLLRQGVDGWNAWRKSQRARVSVENENGDIKRREKSNATHSGSRHQGRVQQGAEAPDHQQKLTDAMVSIEGEGLRGVTWCVVEEVESGDWGIGGNALTTADVHALAHDCVTARPRARRVAPEPSTLVRGAPKVSDQDFRHDRGSACARIV